MQVHTRLAVASHLSVVSLSLSLTLSLSEAAGERLDHYLELPTHLLPSFSFKHQGAHSCYLYPWHSYF